jgi:hypothetical protein
MRVVGRVRFGELEREVKPEGIIEIRGAGYRIFS